MPLVEQSTWSSGQLIELITECFVFELWEQQYRILHVTTCAQAGGLGAARAAGPHELHLLEEVVAPWPTADGVYDQDTC